MLDWGTKILDHEVTIQYSNPLPVTVLSPRDSAVNKALWPLETAMCLRKSFPSSSHVHN